MTEGLINKSEDDRWTNGWMTDIDGWMGRKTVRWVDGWMEEHQ